MAHVFFTSYARADNTRYSKLHDVVLELEELVRGKLGALKTDPIGFIDSKDIHTGEEWQKRLASEVHAAPVLVCMMSPTYFNSEWCAKEFAVFRRRLEKLNPRPRVIIPVLWEHGYIPEALGRFQAAEDVFPKPYVSAGLAPLKRVRGRNAAYKQTLEALSVIIANAAKAQLPPLAPEVMFHELPRAFDNPGPYDVALAFWHPNGPQWSFGLPGSTVARSVETVAASLKVPWRDLYGDVPLKLAALALARQVVVVVTDESCAQKEPFASMLAQLDQSPPVASMGVLVGTSALVADDKPVRTLLPRLAVLGHHHLDAFSVITPGHLEEKLAKAITKLRMAMVSADPPAKVDDAALRAAADQEGIPIANRPALQGPAASTP